jgi:hypothetical protein
VAFRSLQLHTRQVIWTASASASASASAYSPVTLRTAPTRKGRREDTWVIYVFIQYFNLEQKSVMSSSNVESWLQVLNEIGREEAVLTEAPNYENTLVKPKMIHSEPITTSAPSGAITPLTSLGRTAHWFTGTSEYVNAPAVSSRAYCTMSVPFCWKKIATCDPPLWSASAVRLRWVPGMPTASGMIHSS